MPNYLFDIRLNASIRLDAETPEQARAAIKAALDCAEVNAGSWPDGSPIIFEASLDADDCCDEDAMCLIEVDGEDPEAVDLPPPPSWASPIQPGDTAAVSRTIRAAEAQEAAVLAVSDELGEELVQFSFTQFATNMRFAGASYKGERHAGEIVGILMWNHEQAEGEVMFTPSFAYDSMDNICMHDGLLDWIGLLGRELDDVKDAYKTEFDIRRAGGAEVVDLAQRAKAKASSPDTPKEDSTDA